MVRFYREVRPETVAEASRQVCASALSWARADLDTPTLRIRWYVESLTLDLADTLAGLTWWDDEDPERIVGQNRAGTPDDLWIMADRPAAKAAATVLHEAHHAYAHHLLGQCLGMQEYDGRERLAQSYERGYAEIVLAIVTATEGRST